MAYAVWDECAEAGYSYTDKQRVSIRMVGGALDEERTLLYPISRRSYTWTMRRDDCADWLRTDVDDFAIARDFMYSPFLLLDPMDSARTGIAMTLVSGNTYSLPTTITDEDYRHYPRNDSTIVAYDAGTPVAISSVDVDGRTVTLAAPAGGAVTLDATCYRLCRIDNEFQWSNLSGVAFDVEVPITEVLRWSN